MNPAMDSAMAEHDASAFRVEKAGNASSVHRMVWLGVGLQGSAGQQGVVKCSHIVKTFAVDLVPLGTRFIS